MLYFHSLKCQPNPGIRLDIVEVYLYFKIFNIAFCLKDLRHLNTMAVKSFKTGVIILGGGVVKHHINNANLMRNGSDYTVYINTGQASFTDAGRMG
jgi:deoxyhypusine synthase